jgi:hypothetical protein
MCGYKVVVQILLAAGADVNARGDYHGNALEAGSEGGYDGVRVNSSGNYYYVHRRRGGPLIKDSRAPAGICRSGTCPATLPRVITQGVTGWGVSIPPYRVAVKGLKRVY